MISNGIDNGTVTGLTNPSTFVGAATGMLNNEQMISDTNTFIFTVKTNAAVAATTTVQLPLVSTGTYNFWVDWGDGRKDYVTSFSQIYVRETVARTHTYRTVGTYTIRITGVCRGWSFFGLTNEQPKIQSIKRFGCLELINDTTNGQQFAGCSFLDLSNVKDTLSTKYLTNMLALFGNIPNLKVNLLNNWDVSNVTDMVFMFQAANNFNQPIGNWDVSNVTNMTAMLNGANNFNQPIGNWDVSNVTNMTTLFAFAFAFNQDISSWNVGGVTTMASMFSNATAFNQPIDSWNIGNVTNISAVFASATAFNQPIGNWNVSNVTNMASVFSGATAFNQDISKWDVSKVTFFGAMFNPATAFTNGNNSDTNPITGLQGINGWNINTLSNVNMVSMFNGAIAFNQPIGSWNVSRVTNMSNMFFQAYAFNQPIGSWNVSNVTNMGSMFSGATAFNQDIGNWNIGAVTTITNFMSGKTPATFSAANLDAIYNGWSSRPSQSNLSITFGTANYTIAGGSAGRAILVSRGWTIVDGGGI
jgi:surface protein